MKIKKSYKENDIKTKPLFNIKILRRNEDYKLLHETLFSKGLNRGNLKGLIVLKMLHKQTEKKRHQDCPGMKRESQSLRERSFPFEKNSIPGRTQIRDNGSRSKFLAICLP
uniref:Uncharacterized protein n=1 Tax=Cacopsylla melanoneura TaxID=428564 RepID=A0A8D8R261_9HEMI